MSPFDLFCCAIALVFIIAMTLIVNAIEFSDIEYASKYRHIRLAYMKETCKYSIQVLVISRSEGVFWETQFDSMSSIREYTEEILLDMMRDERTVRDDDVII